MTQLLHTLRSLPTARPSRAVRLTTLVLSLAIGTTVFLQAASHPDGYLPLHIAFFALIVVANVQEPGGRWTLALFGLVIVMMVAGWYRVRGRIRGDLLDHVLDEATTGPDDEQ